MLGTVSVLKRGVTSLEVVIGVSIAAIVLTFAVHSIMEFVNIGRTAGEKTKAIYLAEDGLELLRFIRDGDWGDISGLSANTTYYLSVSPAAVSVTTVPQTIDGYTRSFRISNVYRNSSDDIVASTTSGAVVDAHSRYVTMTVAWDTPTSTIALTSMLTEIDP